MVLDHKIIAIHASERPEIGARIQQILTRYSKDVKTRLELQPEDHDSGILIVELFTGEFADPIIAALKSIGVDARIITFTHSDMDDD